MAMTQMNIRIDDAVKREGDAVLARCGFTPSQAVRSLWEYAVRTGGVPPFMAKGREGDSRATRDEACGLIAAGAGLAQRLARCADAGSATSEEGR